MSVTPRSSPYAIPVAIAEGDVRPSATTKATPPIALATVTTASSRSFLSSLAFIGPSFGYSERGDMRPLQHSITTRLLPGPLRVINGPTGLEIRLPFHPGKRTLRVEPAMSETCQRQKSALTA